MDKLKAIILAGGYGTRLRPLTITTPKPLCTICGESVLERLLRLMPDWGVTDVAISTMYLSEKIEEKLGSNRNGINIQYVKEDIPLGSAGGAKLAAKALETNSCDNFLVLSGDGIFDFEIEKAVDFHVKNNADVTIITYPTKEPLEYGVILSNKAGKIIGFSEKPSWSKVHSDTVNTGIYIIKADIFKEIPSDRQFDFSNDLFPFLLGTKRSLYSYEAKGYWCDIGDISAYYKCNMDALCGKIKNIDFSNAFTEKEAEKKGLKVVFPAYISKNAEISKEAKIGKYSIILDNSKINSYSEINGSILFENVSVEENAVVDRSIIGESTVVEKNSRILAGCTVGANCKVCSGATITEGISIWPQKRIEKGFCVTQDILFDNKSKNFYSDNGFYACNIHGSINSDYIARLGSAIALAACESYGNNKLSENTRIGVMHNGKPECALICETLLCGIKSTGCKSFSFLSGFDAEARFIASEFMTDVVLFVTDDADERIIKAYNRHGMQISREFERKVEAFYKSPHKKDEYSIFDTEYIDNVKYFYMSSLLKTLENEFLNDGGKHSGSILNGLKCYITKSSEPCLTGRIITAILADLGAEIVNDNSDDVISIYISDDGMSAVIEEKYQNKVLSLDNYHISISLISYEISSKASIISIPEIASATALRLLSDKYENKIKVLESPELNRHYVKEIRKIYDMCFAVPRLLCILKKQNKSIYDFSNELPQFEIRIRNINSEDTDGEHRASVMKKLYEKYDSGRSISEKDGVTVSFSDGSVTVVPRRTGGFRLISEAVSTEVADELCSAVFDEIKKLCKETKD